MFIGSPKGVLINDKTIRSELGIPENLRIYGSIILGYLKAIPPMPDRDETVILKIIS